MQPCCDCTRCSQLCHPCDKQGRRSCFCKVAVAGQTPGSGRFSYNPSKVHGSGGKQSWQEGRKGREVMETSQGRVIREPEQCLVHPSTSKLSNKFCLMTAPSKTSQTFVFLCAASHATIQQQQIQAPHFLSTAL